MENKISIFKSTCVLLLIIFFGVANAQQSRIDSAIAVLTKSNTPNGLDTLMFISAQNLINTSVLSDAQITQIEKAAGQFKKGIDEDLCYYVKTSILRSLSATDKFKAIDYGHQNLKQLEASRFPQSKVLYRYFLTLLRVPYRTSSKLAEGFPFYTKQLNQFKVQNDSAAISACYFVLAGFYRTIGLYETGIYNMKNSISYADSSITINRPFQEGIYEGKQAWINNTGALAEYYLLKGNFEEAIKYSFTAFKNAIDLNKSLTIKSNSNALAYYFSLWGTAKIMAKQPDSLDYYFPIVDSSAITNEHKVLVAQTKALYKMHMNVFSEADSILQYCQKMDKTYAMASGVYSNIIQPDYYLALLRTRQKRFEESALLIMMDMDRVKVIRSNRLRGFKLLAEIYQQTGKAVQANQAYQAYINLKDSILADQEKFQTISFETEQLITDNEIAISKLESENKLSAQARNFTIGMAALLFILAGSIYYRFRSKKKANEVLEKTLTELKSTQAQLIQSEKMASLGELTAGIAHEIQNPLNFVNNFSELSKELLVEMKEELVSGSTVEASAIADDVIQNLEKINHHGKRADAIVKGMLEHSRAGSGEKEPTDINALADEYLRLAYHGLRAKDPSFNAALKTDFDTAIGSINIIPQDIGRVFLNLINNALYSVNERSKKHDIGYEPAVMLSTKLLTASENSLIRQSANSIIISVKDNGSGIPENIKEKIFQPFFTTKPTGQGTGLGLSLSYDIVKAHGGELRVESTEREGSTFIIQIPITNA
jgi:signal transduction histidine kinase